MNIESTNKQTSWTFFYELLPLCSPHHTSQQGAALVLTLQKQEKPNFVCNFLSRDREVEGKIPFFFKWKKTF